MRFLIFTILIFLACNTNAFPKGVDFTIEDKDLSDVSGKAVSAVSKDTSFSPFKNLGCKLTGKEILLTSLPIRTYFLTTSNACGWGAAVGPIWIVDESHGKVILSTGGYAIEVRRRTRNGFRDIDVNSEIGGEPKSTLYSFKKGKYMPSKSHGKSRHY
ncbi:hypothetical protein [Burkholderia sp. BCC1998]|uniref:hypothetical protein n=1 Tax=Burkholderia sp. BCC1998 TaxID=2817447 RepID=UPI002AB6A1AB|nr:hypothetical protein [Burkholderia sp. BCC1998]